MHVNPLARAVGALVLVAAAATVAFVVLATVLVRVGVRAWVASPAAAGGIVAATLPAADVYTPLGNTQRTQLLRGQTPSKVVVDFALAGVAGGVAGSLGALLVLSPDASNLASTAVVATAVALGYGTFVARNVAAYRLDGPVPAADSSDHGP